MQSLTRLYFAICNMSIYFIHVILFIYKTTHAFLFVVMLVRLYMGVDLKWELETR